MTRARPVRGELSEDDYRAWLPANALTPFALKCQNGRWYALFMEFNIAGTGDSPREAVLDGSQLLSAYLRHCFAEGRPFADSRKPIPKPTELWIRLSALIAFVAQLVNIKLSPAFQRVKQRPLNRLPHRHAPNPAS